MVLPILPQLQEDPRWCWATVTSMVTNFYALQRGAGVARSPCDVASLTLAQPCCPSNPPPIQCQRQDNLQKALRLVGHFNPTVPPTNALSVVIGEISSGRPLCAGIQYFQGAFHYVVLTGFDAAAGLIELIDPADGLLHQNIPYQQFLKNNTSYWAGWILTT